MKQPLSNSSYPQRKRIRLRRYDYTQPGHYFVTLVTEGRALCLRNPKYQRIVENGWRWLAQHHSYVELDEFVVMPNHLHGIVIIRPVVAGEPKRKTLGRLVGAFKTSTTNQINRLRESPGLQLWQLDFFERIIRTERGLKNVRRYIIDNPRKWDADPQNPARTLGGT